MDADCCLLRLPAVLAAVAAVADAVGDENLSCSSRRERRLRSWGCSVFGSAMGGVEEEEERRMLKSDESFSSSTSSDTLSSASDVSVLSWPLGLVGHVKSALPFDDLVKPKQGSAMSEMEMMKERFSKLLLGEDMSGCGKGVCTALAISNAVTNLCGTVFGQIWRLEPLPAEKKAMWRREMEWLLCVSDHIVELTPEVQTLPDGTCREVMACRQRSDLFINLPALRKLDTMLLEILDEFSDNGFWYVDQKILSTSSDDHDDSSAVARRAVRRHENKWWLPVPAVPAGGLPEDSRKKLKHKRDCTGQILKAAMAINSNALAEMDVPAAYLHSLPKTGKAALGDVIYRYVTSEQFSPKSLLDYLDLSSEHRALEIANRAEAAVHVWRRRGDATAARPGGGGGWGVVRELMGEGERREMMAERAEGLLICLKQRFPCLTQTTLDMTKIQCNKDVGKSILESYSRVLESLAFNVVARIDDVLYADDLSKAENKNNNSNNNNNNKLSPVPISSTTADDTTTPVSSPASSCGGRTPFLARNAAPPNLGRGLAVKKALANYLGANSAVP